MLCELYSTVKIPLNCYGYTMLYGLGMSIQFFEILIFLCCMALVTSLVGLVQLLVVSNTVFP